MRQFVEEAKIKKQDTFSCEVGLLFKEIFMAARGCLNAVDNIAVTIRDKPLWSTNKRSASKIKGALLSIIDTDIETWAVYYNNNRTICNAIFNNVILESIALEYICKRIVASSVKGTNIPITFDLDIETGSTDKRPSGLIKFRQKGIQYGIEVKINRLSCINDLVVETRDAEQYDNIVVNLTNILKHHQVIK